MRTFTRCLDLAYFTAWEPYNLHDLGQVSCVGSTLLYSDPAQHLIAASWDPDALQRDKSDLSGLSDACNVVNEKSGPSPLATVFGQS